jgi:hypothetical protein
MKSDKLNKKNVMLAFYKSKTFLQKLKGKTCSMTLIIEDHLYQFRRREKYILKRTYTKEYLKKYLLIDSKFKTKDLVGNWEEILLKQKARDWDRLFIRLRCVKAFKIVLNQLPKKWNYRIGDFLSSIYLRRRNARKR